ncbi:hypothetical protein cyc_08509 [Cyclospora cayetanensis]|uniref:Uncharacterized protein n=1 Tax=Cyclospora cayetanensis TaxID=88456 RepID=A0A1D3CXT5_9EIME|nr:hypothetical protein cyc_08509 [Cyclospora cayetanensis]
MSISLFMSLSSCLSLHVSLFMSISLFMSLDLTAPILPVLWVPVQRLAREGVEAFSDFAGVACLAGGEAEHVEALWMMHDCVEGRGSQQEGACERREERELQNGVGSNRLRQVREHFFSVDFALDVVLSELQIVAFCEGRGVAVPPPRYGQRLFAIECACLHHHLQVGMTGDQTLSMDIEVYPATVLTVARDLESTLTPPEVSVLLLLEPSRQKTKRRRKGNAFFSVLQKVLGRGDGISTDSQEEGETRGGSSRGADPADAPSAAAAAGASPQELEGDPFKGSSGAAPLDGAAEKTQGRQQDYRKRLESIRAFSPGVYLRMDSQLFRTLYTPDLRLLLHSCAGIVVVRAALLRQGEAFCSAVAGGDIQHPNVLLDVELQKTVSFVIPRLASRLECEGIQVDLGSIRAKSLLQPRRLTYPPNMAIAAMVDAYSCE